MKELSAFGLSDTEIQLYMTLLKTGRATANRLASFNAIKRSTVYDCLTRMENKGIVSALIINKVLHFQAADPENLVNILQDRAESVKRLVPKLREMMSTTKEKSSVHVFEGKSGAVALLNDIFAEKNELLFYGSRKMAKKVLSYYPERFAAKRAGLGIHLRGIMAVEDRSDPFYRAPHIKKLTKLRFLKRLNRIPANVFIYSGKVSFLTSFDPVLGFIVKDSSLYQQQKQIFDILWKTARAGG